MIRRPVTVRIIYKSGAEIDIRCKSFTVEGGGDTIKWVDAWPYPLKIGVDEIAAIYQTK